MAYGTVKVDNITFDNGGSDQNVTVSGLYRATTSGVTLSGTIAATTVSGVTVIGSTTVSGATVTGTTANFTSGNFSNIISSAATMSGALIMANQQQVRFREAVGNGVNHIALQAPAIVSADQTITLPDQTGTVITTGDNGSVSSTMLATNLTISAAAGSASAPSIAFTGDLNTGIYSPGADQVAISTNGTERLRIDSSGNVGIGTSAPGTSLDVRLPSASATIGNIRITPSTAGQARYHLYNAGSVAEWLFGQKTSTDHKFKISTSVAGSETDHFTIDTGGNVGIGTTSPGDTLDVYGSISTRNAGGGEGGQVNFYNPDNTTIGLSVDIQSADVARIFSTRNNLNLQIGQLGGTGGNIGLFTAGSERARIDSSGRLLVGTSTARTFFSYTPLHQIENANTACILSITANANAAFSAAIVLTKSRGGTTGSNTVVQNGDELGSIVFSGADGTLPVVAAAISANVDGVPGSNDMPGRLVFYTTAGGASSPTERMRISQDGLTLIKHADAGQVVLRTWNANASFTSTVIEVTTTRAAGTDCFFFSGVANGFDTFVVYNNGNVQNTNNSYAGISDVKLKENIFDAASQWCDIKSLQVRKYNFKKETGQQSHTQIGLVAQEVELVSPGLVTERPDRDAKGNDLGTVTKSVNYSVLYMKAVKALQEAMERIEVLEDKVAALESM